MKQGERIYIESLLSEGEWNESRRRYSTYESDSKYPVPFECEFKWRYMMGAPLGKDEITIINKRLDEVLKKVKK